MIVVTEDYFYSRNGQEYATSVIGVFDDYQTAHDIVKSKYDTDKVFNKVHKSQHMIVYYTFDAKFVIHFKEFELNKLY